MLTGDDLCPQPFLNYAAEGGISTSLFWMPWKMCNQSSMQTYHSMTQRKVTFDSKRFLLNGFAMLVNQADQEGVLDECLISFKQSSDDNENDISCLN